MIGSLKRKNIHPESSVGSFCGRQKAIPDVHGSGGSHESFALRLGRLHQVLCLRALNRLSIVACGCVLTYASVVRIALSSVDGRWLGF